MRVWLIVERNWPTNPAECQVVPSVEVVLLDHHDVGPTEPRQVVGDAATRDAAADHHDAGIGARGSQHSCSRITHLVLPKEPDVNCFSICTEY